jgi:hypothetical protein
MDRSLNVLTPLCDFVARINNEGSQPVLKAFESLDTSGSWGTLKHRFASVSAEPGEFPNALAPLALVAMPKHAAGIVRVGTDRVRLTLKCRRTSMVQESVAALLPGDIELCVSPDGVVSLPDYERKLAGIPNEVVTFYWVYPSASASATRKLLSEGISGEALDDPVLHLLERGGFVYSDAAGDPIMVNVNTPGDGVGYLQFGEKTQLPKK